MDNKELLLTPERLQILYKHWSSTNLDIDDFYKTIMIEQSAKTARQIFEELEKYSFINPISVPENGKELVKLCLSERDIEQIKSRFMEGRNEMSRMSKENR